MDQKPILNDASKASIEKYKKVLEKHGIPVEKIILFGSYAKGTAKPWSDLDLCIVSKTFGKDGHKDLVYLMQLAGEMELMIEPHPYNPKDLKDPFDPLAYEIKTTGIVV